MKAVGFPILFPILQTQEQLTQTLAELAEQNARLVSAVEVLRVRTRMLLWGAAALVLAVVWLAWRVNV